MLEYFCWKFLKCIYCLHSSVKYILMIILNNFFSGLHIILEWLHIKWIARMYFNRVGYTWTCWIRKGRYATKRIMSEVSFEILLWGFSFGKKKTRDNIYWMKKKPLHPFLKMTAFERTCCDSYKFWTDMLWWA